MRYNKITVGFVIQTYEDGICVEQEFFAGDQVDYENRHGDPIVPPANEQYFPFDMTQPTPSQDTTL